MTYVLAVVCAILAGMVLYFLTRPLPSPQRAAKAASHTPVVQGGSLTCTCEEWTRHRAHFRQGDPRRLCRHICAHLAQDTVNIAESLRPFTQLIHLMAEEERGVPYTPPTFAFVLGDSGYLVSTEKTAYPMVSVHMGRNIYTFHAEKGVWGSQGIPPFATDIGSLIQGELRRRMAKIKAQQAE